MTDSLDSVDARGKPFARLEVVAGPNRGRRYDLDARVTAIGREAACDIPLNDELVSRRHAQLEFDGRELWLTDVASTNGTYVNDTRLSTPYRLRDGDRIIMGNTVFVLSIFVENVTVAPAPAPPEAESAPSDNWGTMPVATEDARVDSATPKEPLPAVPPPPYLARENLQALADIESTVPIVASNTFRLRIAIENGAARLTVLEASRTPIEAVFNEPFSDAEWAAVLRQMETMATSPSHVTAALPARVGQQLYGTLLPAGDDPASDIHQAFVLAASEDYEPQGPLTLQLWFNADAVTAARWPWELLHDGVSHLVQTDELRLNRYITYFGRRESPEPVDELRVLLVVARPTDQDELACYVGRDEMASILEGQFQVDGMQVGLLENPTFSSFKARLEAAQSLGMPYHIIHFDGHGSYFGSYDASMLCFEDSRGHTQLVPAKKFAEALAGSSVRLALVSATVSEMGIENGMLTTVGPILIRAGVPAAVAMQSAMPIDAVGAFARGFYESLLRREPVSAAVACGRRAIMEADSAPVTWHSPALYLRAANCEGYLFSEEPREHRRARRVEMTYLAAMWEQMTPEQQAAYEEGPLDIRSL
jgi:pSer/pThr/pTyr-binding forkhead associated (FHA) protein